MRYSCGAHTNHRKCARWGASDTMKAVVISEFGGPEVLELREVARPMPRPEEILVRVRSSGINRADLIQRMGKYPAPPDSPQDIPGLEFAGIVEEVGPGAFHWKPGDAVMGIVGGGGYGEYLVTHERTVVPVPQGISTEDAGAIPEVFMTAFDAIQLQVGLGEGETILIHAVGSGVGTAAVQLAWALGARTIGTARTPEKVDNARALGLDVGIVADEAWPQVVLEATDGQGVDVILDLVGGPYLAGNLGVMASGARQILVGVPGGSKAEIDLRALMGKRASIRGTVLRARPLEEKASLALDFEAQVIPLFEKGVIRPVIDRTFSPEDAPEAHRWMEENRNFGKILLLWD